MPAPSRPARVSPRPAASPWWVVVAMSAATIVLTIDLFGVNVALPTIAHDLDLSDSTLQWVVSIYFLALAAPLVAAGRVGDVLGRRNVLVCGAAVAAAGSLLAASAPSGVVLLLARALSGSGAAFVTALSLSIVSDAFPASRRGFAIGLWSGIGALGAAAGPLVGGAVTETLGWRWLFAINVPVAVAAIVISLVVVDDSRDPEARRVDVSGVALVTAGFGLVSYGLLEGPTGSWTDHDVIGALLLGSCALVAFAIVERRRADPLVELGWLRHRPAVGAGAVAFAGNAVFAIVMLYMTLYLQEVRGDDPIATGLVFLAFTIPLGLGSPLAGVLAGRLRVDHLLATGLVLLAAGTSVLLLLQPGSSLGVAAIGLAINGAGQAVVFNVTNVTDVTSVSTERAGMAAGVISGIRQVGSLLGLAVAGAAFLAAGGVTLATRLPADELATFTDGFRTTMWVALACCVLGLLATPWARRRGTSPVTAPASPAR